MVVCVRGLALIRFTVTLYRDTVTIEIGRRYMDIAVNGMTQAARPTSMPIVVSPEV